MTDEIYLSNNGKGPGIARVISISNGVVTFEYKSKLSSHRKWTRSNLPEVYWLSKSCGWRKSGRGRRADAAAG